MGGETGGNGVGAKVLCSSEGRDRSAKLTTEQSSCWLQLRKLASYFPRGWKIRKHAFSLEILKDSTTDFVFDASTDHLSIPFLEIFFSKWEGLGEKLSLASALREIVEMEIVFIIFFFKGGSICKGS